jgi:hypothetical protein
MLCSCFVLSFDACIVTITLMCFLVIHRLTRWNLSLPIEHGVLVCVC